MIERVETQYLNRALSLETGKVARQAHGAVMLQHGSLVVLATVVSPEPLREGIDYFPLMVDYRERFTAVGKFPGGYLKRESRPTDKEVLTARCIDRPLRPLFPKGYFSEVQVMVQVLSADPAEDPDTMAVIAASACIHTSDIPFGGPVGAVRISKIDGVLKVNVPCEERRKSTLDVVVAGTREKVIMIEGHAKQAPETEVNEAICFGHEQLQPLITLQEELAKKTGTAKRAYTPILPSAGLVKAVEAAAKAKVAEAVRIAGKAERGTALANLKDELVKPLATDARFSGENPMVFGMAFDDLVGQELRAMLLNEQKRVDGRGLDDIRPISCEVGILPRTHGSALFTRGETQSVVVVTLGTADDAQDVEMLSGEMSKKFMLHYTFPPYSVGEAKPVRGPSRRDIGHGDLAERSLRPVLPEEFMYTIRVTSDITESNGSSSLASVCGGCLALMDAGVPISAPVSGISVGLVEEGGKRVMMTDIVGDEDHHGDMDFKVSGTRTGLTGVQVDLKIEGLPPKLIAEILERARVARMKILDAMAQTLAEPRPEISPYAPKIVTTKIPVDKIGLVIGPGGKNVRKIQEETKTKISLEDDGTVQIAGDTAEAAEAGRRAVEAMVAEAEVGRVYEGPVVRILPIGAFVKILPEVDGMVHISEISDERVGQIEEVLQIGQMVKVRVIEIDEKQRVNLSMRHLDEPFDPGAQRERRGGGGGGGGRFHDRRGPGGGGGGFRGRGGHGGGGGGGRFHDRGDRPHHSDRPPNAAGGGEGGGGAH